MRNVVMLVMLVMGCAAPCATDGEWLEVDGVREPAACRFVDAVTLEVSGADALLVVKVGGGAPNGELGSRACSAVVHEECGALLVDADCESVDVHASCEVAR